MKFIRRWGLMHSTHPENVQEHSLRVAQIAHALALIRNRLFGGQVNPERVAVLALYHDASEVLTGDLPTPVKYFNPDIETAYRALEVGAKRQLLSMLPAELQTEYQACFGEDEADHVHRHIVKAADKLCAYIKCLEELATGNQEFSQAANALKASVEKFDLPEVRYFIETFLPSFTLTLDELNRRENDQAPSFNP
jgi:5'-deoxynucleotidase